MITYFKMKKNEWKVKAMIYGTIASFIDHEKELLDFIQKIYIALKDIPEDELQKELVTKLVEIIYKEKDE